MTDPKKKNQPPKPAYKTSAQVLDIPVAKIADPQLPIRSQFDDLGLRDLADSIKANGVIEPIIITATKKGFEVVAGHRRLLASRLAQIPTIPCVVSDKKGLELETIKLHENLDRADLNIVDEANYFISLMEKYKVEVTELARMIKKPEAYIIGRLNITKWPDKIIQALYYNQIPHSVAKHLVQIDDPDSFQFHLDAAIRGGITARTAQQWVIDHRLGVQKPLESSPEPPKRTESPQPMSYTPNCAICSDKVDPMEAKLIHAHPRCIKALEVDSEG